jgi:hypothetical protein
MVSVIDPVDSTLADWPTDPDGSGGTDGDGAAAPEDEDPAPADPVGD